MKWFNRRRQQALICLFMIIIFALVQWINKPDRFKKPALNTDQDQALPILVYLSYIEPSLLPDASPISQLNSYESSLSAQNFNLFPGGDLLPGKDDSNIKLIFSEKPSQQKLKQIFILITTIHHTLPITQGYLLKDNLYLASKNLPDIIINSNSSAEELSKALQLVPSLAKIKKETKIIDLRFKHPIIK